MRRPSWRVCLHPPVPRPHALRLLAANVPAWCDGISTSRTAKFDSGSADPLQDRGRPPSSGVVLWPAADPHVIRIRSRRSRNIVSTVRLIRAVRSPSIRWQADPERRAGHGPSTGSRAIGDRLEQQPAILTTSHEPHAVLGLHGSYGGQTCSEGSRRECQCGGVAVLRCCTAAGLSCAENHRDPRTDRPGAKGRPQLEHRQRRVSRSPQQERRATTHRDRHGLFITSDATGVQRGPNQFADRAGHAWAVHRCPERSGGVVSISVSSLGVLGAVWPTTCRSYWPAHGRRARLINSSCGSQANSYRSTSNGAASQSTTRLTRSC